MKYNLRFLQVAALIMAMATISFGQETGDFGTTGTTVSWGTSSSSGTGWVICVTPGGWADATPATRQPNTAVDNVWIRNGCTATLSGSPRNVKNLTVENNATLKTATDFGTGRYVRIYGTTVTINGTFGTPASVSDPLLYDGLGLENYDTTGTVTITGTGIFQPARVRTIPLTTTSTTTTVFDMDSKIMWDGGTHTGGTGLFPQVTSTPTTPPTFTINAGKTVTFVAKGGIGTSGSSGTPSTPVVGMTLNVNGSMVLDSAAKISFVPGSGATGSLNIGATGSITSKGPFYFGDISFANNGSFTYGPYSSLRYYGSSAQITGSEFPPSGGPNYLVINNAAGVSLQASRTIDSLMLTSGILSLGTNTLTANYTALGGGAGKFVKGKLQYKISAVGTKKWETGNGTDYLPFTAAFSSVTGSDTISVSALDLNVTATQGTITPANKVLRRYFKVTKGAGISAFTTDSVILSYTNADVVEQGLADENTLRVYKYDGSWSSVTIASRDTAANTITATGVNSFSEFVISGAQIAVPGSVTFQVNMKVQSRVKKFDPAKDTVIVRGDFYQGAGNWWDANNLKLTDVDGDSIYVGTFNVGPVPKRITKYKFVKRGPSFVGDIWEINMGVNNDRTDTIPSTPWTLPVVWFDYDSTSNKILVLPTLPINFDSANVDYTFSSFGATTTKIANPFSGGINTSGFVGKSIKGAPDSWAGSYITLSAPVDFSKGKFFKAKVYMPKVGAKMLFKLENLTNGGIAKELDAIATKANAWEELTWDFSTIDVTKQYQKFVVIFDNGTSGDGSANFTYYFDDVKQSLTSTGVGHSDNSIVTKYELLQNYPNPFNPTTNIDFALLTSGWVNLTVYNVVGQKVATLVNQHMEAGRHYASFNAANLTSGVYFYKITTGKFTSIKKMMLLK